MFFPIKTPIFTRQQLSWTRSALNGATGGVYNARSHRPLGSSGRLGFPPWIFVDFRMGKKRYENEQKNDGMPAKW